jgi:hypothetical protein
MAQKIQTIFVDDIDGSEAEGTVRFGLDGTDCCRCPSISATTMSGPPDFTLEVGRHRQLLRNWIQ